MVPYLRTIRGTNNTRCAWAGRFEKISVLPKVYSTNRPNRLKTLLKVFWQFKTLLKVVYQSKTLLKFICWACSCQTLLCFAIHLTIVTSHLYHMYPTVMQIIVSTKDDLRPHRPPPRPLLAPCWRRRHRYHGCRVVATIPASPLPLPLPQLPSSPPPPALFLLLLLPLFG